jgi:hypothetical protein
MRQFFCSKNFMGRFDQQRHNFQTMKQMNAKYADNANKKTVHSYTLFLCFI